MKTIFKLMALATFLSVSFIGNAWSVDDEALEAPVAERLGEGGTNCEAIAQNTAEVPQNETNQTPNSDTPSSTTKQ